MKHAEAVEMAVDGARLSTIPEHAPLVELCRVLAAQMDAAGTDPTTRLTAAYLSALKDLRRAILDMPAQPVGTTLAELRSLRGRPRPKLKRES